MFGHITGKIFDLKGGKSIVKASGMGFVVHSTLSYLGKLKTGQEASFWTHTAVRENDISLYGFETEEELRVFELLITVSGVGPKSGLAILSVAGVKSIEEAVATKDTSSLTKISGIGRKTAEKIVIELREKIGEEKSGTSLQGELDAMEALKSLGYSQSEAREALKKVKTDTDTNTKIREALKILGGR